MLLLKYLLFATGITMIAGAAALAVVDLYLAEVYRLAAKSSTETIPERKPIRWQKASKVAAWGLLPLLLGLSIAVVPSGEAGVRVSQISRTRSGTLYPGIHFVKPLIERIETFDIRDRVFTTEAAAVTDKKAPVLNVQAREGLTIGLSVMVRYRLDPKRLDYIQSSLPQPVEEELVPPTVSSVFRDVVSAYTVRDVFAAHREEIRQRAADQITKKLGGDAKVSQGLRDSFWLQGMLASHKAVFDCIKAFSETDFTEDLKKFDVPTLVLHGDDDQIVPIGASAMLSSKVIKGAQLKIYKGAPHGMCSTLKDQLNAELLAFLRGAIAPSRVEKESARVAV